MLEKCNRCGEVTYIMAKRDGKTYCAACDTYLETCKRLGLKPTMKRKTKADQIK